MGHSEHRKFALWKYDEEIEILVCSRRHFCFGLCFLRFWQGQRGKIFWIESKHLNPAEGINRDVLHKINGCIFSSNRRPSDQRDLECISERHNRQRVLDSGLISDKHLWTLNILAKRFLQNKSKSLEQKNTEYCRIYQSHTENRLANWEKARARIKTIISRQSKTKKLFTDNLSFLLLITMILIAISIQHHHSDYTFAKKQKHFLSSLLTISEILF